MRQQLKRFNRLLLVSALAACPVTADELGTYILVLENHLFFPAQLTVPAGKKFKLIIENRDATPEEFDSFDLNREKVIFGRRQSTIFVGPLAPGSYTFFGEYHSATARGVLTAQAGAENTATNTGGNDAD
jgi:hypothetical protein